MRFVGPLFIGFLAIVSGFQQAHAADQNVVCIQEQLVEEGIDPGPVDGLLGRATRSALVQLKNSFVSLKELPTLSKSNSSVYCRAIGLARNSRTGWSSEDGLVLLKVGSQTPSLHGARSTEIANDVQDYFLNELQVNVPQSIEVAVSTSATEAGRLADASLKRRGEEGSIATVFEDWCDGYGYCGMSFGGVIAISFDNKDRFPEGDFRRLLAHELAHEVQAQYVGNFRVHGARHRQAERGPKWLTEALADALAIRFQQRNVEVKYLVKRYNSKARYSSQLLKGFVDHKSAHHPDFKNHAAFAGLLLLSRSSLESILGFWENTPSLGWEKSFELAFGLSVDEFYHEFRNLD